MKFTQYPVVKAIIFSTFAFNTFAKPVLLEMLPILEHNCVSCHREDNAKGNVRLDTKEATLAGDDVLVPRKPEDSSLYWTTTLPLDDELVMPPLKMMIETTLCVMRKRKF